MSDDFGFIGWNNIDNHDKVWGYFLRPSDTDKEQKKKYGFAYDINCVVFWAARGKAMQFKASNENYDLHKLVRSKIKKGYQSIEPAQLLEIWPTFNEEMKLKLTFEILSGKVK